MRIGLVSDTHLPALVRSIDEMGPEPAAFFSSVDLVLHGGDLTSPIILDWLEQFAPVLCSTGNNDPLTDSRMEEVQILDIDGWRIGMVHSLDREFRPVHELQKAFPAPVDIIVSGHTHLEQLKLRDEVVLINSGSLTFPQHKDLRLGGVGLLEIGPRSLHAEIIAIGETPGRPNPVKPMVLDI